MEIRVRCHQHLESLLRRRAVRFWLLLVEIRRRADRPKETGDGSELGNRDGESGSGAGSVSASDPSTTSIRLICVTGESDFDVIRVWGEGIIQVGF